MSVYLISGEVQAILYEAKTKGHTNLYLNYQHLAEFPQELLELSKAEKLYLKYNILTELPSDIWKLESLVELYLHSNTLQALPEEIGQLPSLKSLNISNNYLKSLPSTIGHLRQLEYLHLANNLLLNLPKSLGSLHSLKVFDIMNNDLVLLPWQLCYCHKLETLSFDGNKIEWIPRQLTKLEHLKELSGSRNRLTFIPQDIDHMLLLESLVLDSNTNLTVLPATILRLPYLSILGIHRCGSQKDTEHSSNMCKSSKCFSDATFIGSALHRVCPLIELCLRTVYKLFYAEPPSFSTSDFILPGNLANLLQSPTGHCYYCEQAFFVGLFVFTANGKRAAEIRRQSVQGVHDILEEVNMDVVFALCSLECLKVVEELFLEE